MVSIEACGARKPYDLRERLALFAEGVILAAQKRTAEARALRHFVPTWLGRRLSGG